MKKQSELDINEESFYNFWYHISPKISESRSAIEMMWLLSNFLQGPTYYPEYNGDKKVADWGR